MSLCIVLDDKLFIYKYFVNNEKIIIDDLQIRDNQNKYKLNLFKAIALHYNSDLSFVYYIKAIRYLKQTLNDFDEYTFVIFGEKANDDFIKDINLNLDKPFNYIKIYERYENIKDYEEFLYMSSCQHFIIANSTFSWFAAYLYRYKNKIVIHPTRKKWFAEQVMYKYDFKDYFLDNWIEIDF